MKFFVKKEKKKERNNKNLRGRQIIFGFLYVRNSRNIVLTYELRLVSRDGSLATKVISELGEVRLYENNDDVVNVYEDRSRLRLRRTLLLEEISSRPR